MNEPVVKICGIKTVEAAKHAVEAGADLTGIILVPNRARTIDVPTAVEISKFVREKRRSSNRQFIDSNALWAHLSSLDLPFEQWYPKVINGVIQNGPFLVGVFRNQSVEEINDKIDAIGLDFVQLHGSEDPAVYIPQIKVPVIKRITIDHSHEELLKQVNVRTHLFPLLDSEFGGEGKKTDWEKSHQLGELGGRYLLAGGLTPENVADALKNAGAIGVDVAGGVETDGAKDLDKITKFIRNAKA